MDKIIITKPVHGPCHMQICAHKDATAEEIVTHANLFNLSGVGRWGICREISEFWGDMRPVPCNDYPDRIHYMLSC